MLQPLEMRRSLSHPAVGDARTVAEGQAGEAAAVPSHRHQGGVGDVRKHAERQPLEVRVLHHLKEGSQSIRYLGFQLQMDMRTCAKRLTWVMLLSVSLMQAERSSS